MVNKKTRTQLGAGMDINAGQKAGKGVDEAGENNPALQIKMVSYAMEPNCMQARITECCLQSCFCSGIAQHDRINIFFYLSKHVKTPFFKNKNNILSLYDTIVGAGGK